MSQKRASELLAEMMDTFVDSTQNLLAISQRYIRTFDRAQYGVVIAKLSKRLRVTLAVEKEVAVVFSYFNSPQMRTIFFARKTIGESGGRLDSNIFIIVHKARSGNETFVDWGREEGFTVLPIYVNGVMPSGENLERKLSSELFSHDHFDVTGPVSDDSQFYGRKDEAQELARKLRTGQIRARLGIRKIGKTSIVNRIIKNLQYDESVLSVMIDCSKDDIWSLDASGLMWSIAEDVSMAIDKDRSYVSISASSSAVPISESRERLTESILRCNRVVILFMDEFDYISPSSPKAAHWKTDFNDFWRNFRVTYQELTRSNRQNLSLLVSGISSKWFSVAMIEDVENAALAFIPEEYLSPLPRAATSAMIKKLSRASGLLFDAHAREKIADVAADMPYWVRKACSFIHRKIDINKRPYSPSENEIVIMLKQFVDYEGATLARFALGHLFSVYPELEPVALKCSKGEGDSCARYHLEILRRYGIITGSSDGNVLSGQMIMAGFAQHIEEQDSNQNMSENADDWTETLLIINKSRNILERKLRDTAFYFLKADSFRNKGKGTVQDRLLKAVQSGRRAQLERKTGEEIIESFLWSELSTLVGREWNLFEPIFSDRKKFLDYCEIVNDRPDAHARPVDSADFALYRRAFDWLSGKLNQ